MFGTLRNDVDVTFAQLDSAFSFIGISERNVEATTQNEEELVGVFMNVPQVLALDVGHFYVVIVNSTNYPGTINIFEGS